MLGKRVRDEPAMSLLREIIGSFSADRGARKGIPIGNLTSQLFANVYMNAFDQFMKHVMRVEKYVRYTDDFIIVSRSEEYLRGLLAPMRVFLRQELHLDLHPHKVTVRKYRQGIDFLGYILLPHHRVLRTTTKQRIFRKMREKAAAVSARQSLQSYLGVLSHADCFRLGQDLQNQFWYSSSA
jgi:hypothetical protein